MTNMTLTMKSYTYVDKSPIEGRGLFVTCDKGAGETLEYVERPMATALNIKSLDHICSNCFGVAKHRNESIMANQVDSLMMCKGCKVNRFCSKVRLSYLWTQPMQRSSIIIGACKF